MIYGIYLSAQGADVQTRRLDVIANNLANASTTAFKRDLALIQSHPTFSKIHGKNGDPDVVENATGGTTLAGIATDYRDATLNQTGNSLDLAVRGPGFFRVSDGGSQQFLTRAGNFAVNAQGEVVTQSHGHHVLNRSGNPITIPAEVGEIVIGEDGRVTGITQGTGDAIPVGQLDVVTPDFAKLKKFGENLYHDDGSAGSAGNDVSIQQGFLEASGTRPMQDMLEMIETSRVLEMNVNTIRLQDESLGRLLQAMPNR